MSFRLDDFNIKIKIYIISLFILNIFMSTKYSKNLDSKILICDFYIIMFLVYIINFLYYKKILKKNFLKIKKKFYVILYIIYYFIKLYFILF
jgi:hypothetical protein